ncbi:MAG: mersacidin/lichenicidin family type 2 lantibiotic [bacterium]
MSKVDIIRAWKDEEYRLSLSDAEQAMLPANPAGIIELTGTELDIVGGARPNLSAATTCYHGFCSNFCSAAPPWC